jgi:hypothetical protein
MPRTDAALAAVRDALEHGGDADDILRRVVATLHDSAGYPWSGIFFVESGQLVLGPDAGAPEAESRTRVPVTWQGNRIAELAVDGAPDEDHGFLTEVATLVAEYCLVGWDTGGEAWLP